MSIKDLLAKLIGKEVHLGYSSEGTYIIELGKETKIIAIYDDFFIVDKHAQYPHVKYENRFSAIRIALVREINPALIEGLVKR